MFKTPHIDQDGLSWEWGVYPLTQYSFPQRTSKSDDVVN